MRGWFFNQNVEKLNTRYRTEGFKLIKIPYSHIVLSDLRYPGWRDEVEEPGLVAALPSHLLTLGGQHPPLLSYYLSCHHITQALYTNNIYPVLHIRRLGRIFLRPRPVHMDSRSGLKGPNS